MTRRRSAGVLVVAVVALTSWAGPVVPGAGAVGDGGASTTVTRDGRIITWILFPERRVARPGHGGTPREVWVTLGDAEVSFLVHLLAARPDARDDPLVGALAAAVGEGVPADVTLQLLVRDGAPTTVVRAVPAAPGVDGASAWARRMVTVLPSLVATVTPPADAPVPVGAPVFVSFTAAEWARVVDRTLSAGGVTARVRARPEAFRLSTGDPADVGRTFSCQGPGRPFDPADAAPPAVQARRPGTCAVVFRSATGVRGRRDAWYGELTVLWRAEWTTDGTTWRPLGLVPRLSVLRRSVQELGTAVDRP